MLGPDSIHSTISYLNRFLIVLYTERYHFFQGNISIRDVFARILCPLCTSLIDLPLPSLVSFVKTFMWVLKLLIYKHHCPYNHNQKFMETPILNN